MAESVDARDSKSRAARRASSSLARGTIPILLETELTERLKLSVKPLRAWRQHHVEPRWYTLGRHVRRHVADVLAYEVGSLQANFADAKTMAAYAKAP